MFNNIEKNLYERIGAGLFIALFVAFLFTVLFQSYVYQYKSAFFGFAVATILVTFGFFVMLKIKEELEADEKR